MTDITIERTKQSIKLTTVLPTSGHRTSIDVFLPWESDYLDYADGITSRKPEPKINWPALGSVSIEDANAFAKLIQQAAVEAAARRTA